MNYPIVLDNETKEKLMKSARVRRAITKESLGLFFQIYMAQYATYPFAKFHYEMFSLAEDEAVKLMTVMAFRNSGKSSVLNTAYSIWSVLGKPQKKFVIIFSQTQAQAKQHFENLKVELQSNSLLKRDLGPFSTEDGEWGGRSIVLPKYGARIMLASSEQSIRGIRHGANRPDLIICDDVEDIASAKTKEGRDKIFQWFTGEVLPAGDEKTKVVVLGNMVHEDSLLARLQEAIYEEDMPGVFRSYPLLTENETCLWPERYPEKKEVDALKGKIGDEVAWQREYLLHIIADADRVIERGWIQYYDQLPPIDRQFSFGAIGVDLAISQKSSADYTAMVSAAVFTINKRRVMYILPRPVNERLSFPDTIEKVKNVYSLQPKPKSTTILVENVSYQAAMWQELNRQGYNAKPFDLRGQDKRTRLALLSELIKNGTVLFPKEGAKDLINQIVNFGVEKHDDLADAFVACITFAREKKEFTPGIAYDTSNRQVYNIRNVFPGLVP